MRTPLSPTVEPAPGASSSSGGDRFDNHLNFKYGFDSKTDWVELTAKYTNLPLLIRSDGQLALTPSDQRDGGAVVYAAGKTHAVAETFDEVRVRFGIDVRR